MAFAKLRAVLSLDDKASVGLKGFGRVLSNIGQIAGGNLLASFARDGVRALKNMTAAAINVGAGFEQGMSNVAAVSGATGAQLAALSEQARDFGKSTVFSAIEASAAMESFAKAGFSVNEILKATGPTLELAAAGQLSMGQAASITANAIRAFGLEASDAQDVSDLLAKAANSANLTVADMGQAFGFAAASSSALGIDMTETAAAIDVLANSGIPAARAGRALASALTELVTGVDETGEKVQGLGIKFETLEDGSFSIIDALKQMEAAGVTSRDALAGLSRMSGTVFSTFLNQGVPALEAMDKALRDRLGFGAEVARKRLDNLRGDTTLFKSAATELGIVLFGKLKDGFRAVVQHGTNFVTRLGEMFDRGSLVREIFFNLALAAIPVARGFVAIAAAAFSFLAATASTAKQMKGFAEQFGFLKIAISFYEKKLVAATELTREQDDIFGLMIRTLDELETSLKNIAANPPVTPEGIAAMEEMKALLQEITTNTTVAGEAEVKMIDGIRELIEEGHSGALDLISELDNGARKMTNKFEGLGKTIKRSLRGIGIAAATDFGDALVDAAFTGKFAFKDFMRSLLKDIARAIIQAIILKTILGVSTAGAAVAVNSGGVVQASRGFIPMASGGFNRKRDSVPALLTRGEAVLPVELTDFLIEAATGGGGRGDDNLQIELNSDIPLLVASINRRVRNHSISLESTKVVSQRGNV